MLTTILAFLVVIGGLIFVHELGHFMAAKAVDIEVPRFSIGLGPKMIGFTRGETEYVICWLPLGGYVKMAGTEEMEMIEGGPSPKTHVTGAGTAVDLGVETDDVGQRGPRDFESKSLPARTLVISAGVLMNLLFAFLVFAISALVWGVPVSPPARIGSVTEELLPKGAEALANLPRGSVITAIGRDNVKNFRDLSLAIAEARAGDLQFRLANAPAVTIRVGPAENSRDSLIRALDPEVKTAPAIGEITKNSAADKAGLKPHDRVLQAAGEPITTWQQLVAVVEQYGGKQLPLIVERDHKQVEITAIPDAKSIGGKTYGRLGVTADMLPDDIMPRERPGPIGAIAAGASQTWHNIVATADVFWKLVSGAISPRNVGGPILIGQMSGKVARMGLEAFLSFMAFFSINLAVLNVLPIPVLDGGHLMFLAIEGVRGRPLSLNQRMKFSQVGFAIIVLIMVWAVGNDVLRLFGI